MDRRTGDSNLSSLLNRREAIVAIAAACCANVDRVRTTLAAEPRQESETRAESLDWDKSRREAFAQKELDEYNAVARKNGFPANGRVKTTPRFVVVYNASEAYAEWVAALAEEVAKGFEKFAVKLGFKRVKLSKPLSIFVFAERALFDVWERKLSQPSENEGARLGRSMGFYATGIDRMFVYDQTEIEAYRVAAEAQNEKRPRFTQGRVKREGRAIMARDGAVFNTSTIAHELTHQMCYNYGVLRSNGRSPGWLVEGLATIMEPCDENAALGWRYRNKPNFNAVRFRRFCDYANYKDGDLRLVDELVVSDRPIRSLSSDAYCVSWAMAYYCYVKRSKDLAKFIEKCAEKKRDEIEPGERRRDFVESFGEIEQFKNDFAKFMKSF